MPVDCFESAGGVAGAMATLLLEISPTNGRIKYGIGS